MTYKLELLRNKDQSMEDFIKVINNRLRELDTSIHDVKIIHNDYRPEVYAIIVKNVRYLEAEPKTNINDIVWEYKKISQEDIDMVATQANVSKEKAEKAIRDSKGDLAKAIISLTIGDKS